MNPRHYDHPQNVVRRLTLVGRVPESVAGLIRARNKYSDALYWVESLMREARAELTPEQYDALLESLTDQERAKVASTAPRPRAS